jgi:hypothetical protein
MSFGALSQANIDAYYQNQRVEIIRGKQIEIKSIYASETNELVEKITSSYTSDSLLLCTISEVYIAYDLINYIKEEFSYDSLRNCIKKRISIKNDHGDFKLIKEVINHFSILNQLTYSEICFVEGETQKYKEEYTYNSSGVLLGKHKSYLSDNNYYPQSREAYTYLEDGKLDRILFYYLNNNLEEFTSIEKYTYSRDNKLVSTCTLDNTGGQILNKVEYVYDTDGFIVSEKEYVSNEEQKLEVIHSKSFIYIPVNENQCDNVLEKEWFAFPNPFNRSFNLSFSSEIDELSLKLFAFNGEEVAFSYRRLSPFEIEINTENIPSGIYFVSINLDDNWSSRRVIKID